MHVGLPNLAVNGLCKNGDKVINDSNVTYLRGRHDYLQGNISACWSRFLWSVLIKGFTEVEIKP